MPPRILRGGMGFLKPFIKCRLDILKINVDLKIKFVRSVKKIYKLQAAN